MEVYAVVDGHDGRVVAVYATEALARRRARMYRIDTGRCEVHMFKVRTEVTCPEV